MAAQIESLGVVGYVFYAFIAYGMLFWLSSLRGLLFGPIGSKPVDRSFYLLFFVASTGWFGCFIAFFGEVTSGTESLPPYLFLTCWAILAVGIGLLLGLRWEMLNAHMRYEAEHGFPLWRPLAKLQWAIWERQQAATVKGFPRFIGGLFVLIGTCILAYVLLNHETTLPALAREWAGSFTAVRILIGLS